MCAIIYMYIAKDLLSAGDRDLKFLKIIVLLGQTLIKELQL